MSARSARCAVIADNRLLAAMSPEVSQRILENSEIVTLKFGDVLCEYGKKPHHVYFPLSCLISLVICIDDHAPFELALIGPDGMLGASEVLGVSEAPMRAIVQSKGPALKMSLRKFNTFLEDVPLLQSSAKAYLFELMEQVNKTAGCSQFHQVSGRLARWLLTTADRSNKASCSMTQQFLSEILGVQRSAVSIAASFLQDKNLISYSRGLITIVDRTGLEAESCSCYTTSVSA